MSRLANKKIAGYFPTPPAIVERIAGHLAPPGRRDFRWLDPCAGTGTALAYLAQIHGGETYGIELDRERAEAAARILDRVLAGDYAAMRLPKSQPGISVIFCNPPYDHDDDATGSRLELTFLRDTQAWLMAGGVLVYIIPQYRISLYIAKRLSTHFRDVRIYRFPDPDYARFRQAVIFAVKRAKPEQDDAAALRIAQAKTGVLPVLPYSPSTALRQAQDGRSGRRTDDPYRIPPAPDSPFYFRPAEARPEDALAEAHTVGVWNTKAWADHFQPSNLQPSNLQPLMPLRRGHIAMVLAAGLLDNLSIARGDQHLLVKGRLNKVQIDVATEQDRDNDLRRTREKFQASITTLDLTTGEITTLANETTLRAWLSEWQDVLAARIVETFEPLHQMTYDGLAGFVGITSHHSKHRHLLGRARTGLFEAQRQVVAALIRRYLANHSFTLLQVTMGTGKSTIAASLADVLKKTLARDRPFPVIVVYPPHLTGKWPREIAGVVPMAQAMVVRRPRDLDAYVRQLQRLDPRTLCVAVVSSEMLKLGSGWTPAVVRQRGRCKRLVETVRDGEIVDEIQRLDTFAWPRCGEIIYHRDEA